ncbi:zinc finger C2HC domain-containing protein 1A [Trichonephila clavata]|uniref:Zinc finger C2HC domain-containing protein 1A n=1 Tax=Trichonephila clavata TaxID=2740835 RepID=A0A8X6I155_TRICU|nr:zinc finger C2HC domain-containing protein 1A [Trichonephila clavata]
MSFSINDQSDVITGVEERAVLKSCHICGRTFNPQSLERHEKICEKSRKCTHRTVFNSFLQRAKEIRTVPVTVEVKEKEKSKLRGKWKEEHENLLHIVRSGKNSSKVLNNGLSPQKAVPPGYEQCPCCKRHFNEKAAERHILWCQEQKNRLPKTPPSSEALERLKARVRYQAPLPRKRNTIDTNSRLVKSAESVRESSRLRTHSSPPIASRDPPITRHSLSQSKPSNLKQHRKIKTRYMCDCF